MCIYNIVTSNLSRHLIFWCMTTFSTVNYLKYFKQDFSVSYKIFLGNISLSSVSLCSISSWCTRITIFSITSWISRLSWSTRYSFKISTRLSFTTRFSRSSRSSWYTLISLVTFISPLAIS